MRVHFVAACLMMAGCAGPPGDVPPAAGEPYPLLNNVTGPDLYAHRIVADIDPGQWSLFHIALDGPKYNEQGAFDGDVRFFYDIMVEGAEASMIELRQEASAFDGAVRTGIDGRYLKLNDGEAVSGGIGVGVVGGDPSSFDYPPYEFIWAIQPEGAARWILELRDATGKDELRVAPVAVGNGLGGGAARADYEGTELVVQEVGALSLDIETLMPRGTYADSETITITGALDVEDQGILFAHGAIRGSAALKQWRYDVAGHADEGRQVDGAPALSQTGLKDERFQFAQRIDAGPLEYHFHAEVTGLGRTPATLPLWPVEAAWGYVTFDPYDAFGWPEP